MKKRNGDKDVYIIKSISFYYFGGYTGYVTTKLAEYIFKLLN